MTSSFGFGSLGHSQLPRRKLLLINLGRIPIRLKEAYVKNGVYAICAVS